MPSMIEILVIPSAHALFEYKISHVFNKKYEYLQDDARYQLVCILIWFIRLWLLLDSVLLNII